MFKFEIIPTSFNLGRVKSICICTSQSYLAIGVSTGSVYLQNIETHAQVHVLSLLKEPAVRISISPDEKYIALVSASSFLVAEIATKRVVSKITVHSNEITALAWGISFFLSLFFNTYLFL